MASLDRMLATLSEAAPAIPKDPAEELLRNRELQQALTVKAIQAADEKWPGFWSLFQKLMDREQELSGKVGLA